jgi:uncharacterized membrane protein
VKKKLKSQRNQILEEIKRLRNEFLFYVFLSVALVVTLVACLLLLMTFLAEIDW